MTDLEEISMKGREGGSDGTVFGVGGDVTPGKQNRRSSSDVEGAGEKATQTQGPAREPQGEEYAALSRQSVDGLRKDPPSVHDDFRAGFYEHYHKEAEEHDKEFMKKHDEDLNTTLIFAGLFSAVTSAFIIQVHSQLQPDSNEETVALLRVLIHKIDNTTFGDNVPALPQWTGPPQPVVQVQCLLYASLSASLFSAFLAMLGKQWLNRYAAADMRGSAIQRSQNRQRKLDGIVAWYFDHVMESLPLMLQAALLLLGCALSQYLWDIDTTVASVVLGVTSFGVLFYIFIVVAGAASESCPYQTPWTTVIRRVPGLLRSAHALFVKHSDVHSMSARCWNDLVAGPAKDAIIIVLFYPVSLLIALAVDFVHLGRTTFQILVNFTHRARNWLFSTFPDHAFDNQATKLDLRCILWILQTSLDKTIKTSTLNFLGTILPLPGRNPSTNSAVVVDCFNIFSSCFITSDGVATMVTRGSEELAGISAVCFLRAFACLSSTEPTSAIIRYICQRYKRVFPSHVDQGALPCPLIMSATRHLFTQSWQEQPFINWKHYNPSTDELVHTSRALVQAARFEYHRGGGNPEVSDWSTRFALRFLSQDQFPPTSVILDCLTIIATNLGRHVPDNGAASDESARLEQVFTLIIQEYERIGAASEDLSKEVSKLKATIAFLPYAARQEENGLVLPISLKYAVLDAFRHQRWFLYHTSDIGTMMQLWTTAIFVLPRTTSVSRGVVDTLLRMAYDDELRPHIPVVAWDWLKERPILDDECWGLRLEIKHPVIQAVRELRDPELITSYLAIVWSERTDFDDRICRVMFGLIVEELSGIGAIGYRADLIKRLDDVLSQLNSEYAVDFWRKRRYGELMQALLVVDAQTMKILTGCHSTFSCALPLPCP